MYLQALKIKNLGPISELNIVPSFNGAGRPKPIVLVGENGSGKSLVLASIVNSLIAVKQAAFDDAEVEKGKVYKFRSPTYIKLGASVCNIEVELAGGLWSSEIQLNTDKSSFSSENQNHWIFQSRGWAMMGDADTSMFQCNAERESNKARKSYMENCCLYFPPNRSEEPAWLNASSITKRAIFNDPLRLSHLSERNIISQRTFQEIRDWLLDLTYDSRVLEQQILPLPIGGTVTIPLQLAISRGPNTTLLASIGQIFSAILGGKGVYRIGIGAREQRTVSIMLNEQPYVYSLSQLSSGQIQLLYLALNIIRDYKGIITTEGGLRDIKGIVLVDEIDLHLHVDIAKNSLPKIMKLFPGVQFIVTNHSPVFLLGMDEQYGENEYEIREMPAGEVIQSEKYREFSEAFAIFQSTVSFRNKLDELASLAEKRPIVLVEGPTDISIIETAWSKLYPAVDMPFRLQHGFNCSMLRTILNDERTINKGSTKLLALFDFDEAYDDWASVRNFIAVVEDESVGLLKKHPAHDVFAALLPIPQSRAIQAGRRFQSTSCLQIELLFEDGALDSIGHLNSTVTPGGGKMAILKGNKAALPEKVKGLDASAFVNFRPLLEMLKSFSG